MLQIQSNLNRNSAEITELFNKYFENGLDQEALKKSLRIGFQALYPKEGETVEMKAGEISSPRSFIKQVTGTSLANAEITNLLTEYIFLANNAPLDKKDGVYVVGEDINLVIPPVPMSEREIIIPDALGLRIRKGTEEINTFAVTNSNKKLESNVKRANQIIEEILLAYNIQPKKVTELNGLKYYQLSEPLPEEIRTYIEIKSPEGLSLNDTDISIPSNGELYQLKEQQMKDKLSEVAQKLKPEVFEGLETIREYNTEQKTKQERSDIQSKYFRLQHAASKGAQFQQEILKAGGIGLGIITLVGGGLFLGPRILDSDVASRPGGKESKPLVVESNKKPSPPPGNSKVIKEENLAEIARLVEKYPEASQILEPTVFKIDINDEAISERNISSYVQT